MRTVELQGTSPREWGRAHGESLRQDIHEISAIRTELTVKIGGFESEDVVRELAAQHVSVLEQFDRDLHEELLGIAEGSDLSPAQIVIVNHYTDLRDIGRNPAGQADGCSAVLLRGPSSALLAQTWDMHGSAGPYVAMLHVPRSDATPEAWLLTIAGCLGMTGLNEWGLGITINNLRSLDARVGVVWPAVVRRVLREQDAESGRDVVMNAPLGSGHHYLIASSRHSFGIETSGTQRKIVFDRHGETYLHTNHCIDPQMAAVSEIPENSSTKQRYETLTETLTTLTLPTTAQAAWNLLAKVSHDDTSENDPHALATCAAIIMDLRRKRIWGKQGLAHTDQIPDPFVFDGQDAVSA